MIPLYIRGEEATTVFDLLGKTENDMTYGLGWCLSQVPSFLDRIGDRLGTPDLAASQSTIRLQEFRRGTGVTDVEIYAPGYAVWIIEAKRGFTVPTRDQLEKYAERLRRLKDPGAKRGLAVLAQSDRNNEWLRRNVPRYVEEIPVHALSWAEVRRSAEEAAVEASHAGKRALQQFIDYLNSVASMQNHTSNWVYVVSLSHDTFGGTTTFVDVVEKHLKYFHPVGGGRGGWPSEPPNYIAFRYDGGLQSIHHVDDYEVITDWGSRFPGQPPEESEPHFLYQLGPPIKPAKWTPTGARWRANRVWCYIDTLLTADTIAAAREMTVERERRMS